MKNRPGFEALYEMDSCQHVKAGVNYPPVLLYHGANDTRVELWQSLKMAAHLMAAQGDKGGVMMRIDYHTGHGSGTSRSQEIAQQADLLAFFFSRCR